MNPPDPSTLATFIGSVAGTAVAAYSVRRAFRKDFQRGAEGISNGQVHGQQAIEYALRDINESVKEISKDVRNNRDEFITAFSSVKDKISDLDLRFSALRADMTKQHGQLSDRVTTLEGSIENRVKIENRITILESLWIQKNKQ